jgi:hypothetical protein
MRRELIYLFIGSLMLGVVLTSAARANLIGWWRFDEGAGTVAADTSGNGNDGTLEGDPTFVDGQFGYALAFEASRVTIPASDTLTDGLFLGSFTLVAWINPTRTGNTWQQIFRSIKTNGESNDTLFINNNGRLSWRGRVDRAWVEGMCETTSGVAATDQWTHVAIVGDGTYFRIYVNGSLSRQSAFQTTDGTNATYYIGGDPATSEESYTGLIDDIRVFNNAMRLDDIRSAMESQGGAILKAYNPNPANGAVHPETWVSLGWTTGSTADSHDVYFGENIDDVKTGTGGTFRGNQASNYFLVGLPGCPYSEGLAPDTTYYWRVDEVEADGVTVHEGSVWRFSVSSGKASVVVIPNDGDWASTINALQPGDIGQLQAGRYLGGTIITVSGTPDKPIIIRGAGYLESVFDGGSGNYALRLDGCSNLIIENITVTNPSPIGIDGRENYSDPARNRLSESDPGYSTLAEGMIIKGGGSRITIRRSFFMDIATRGIFVGTGGVDDLTVEHNIFLRVSDDTAGGDVAAGSSATRMTVRENLLAGNVDGIVTDGAGAGHIFERNLSIFHRWEDGMDIKRTWKRKDEDQWTIIRNNVFYSRLNRYSAVSIQFGTDYVKVLGNVFHGTGGTETILIRGRNGSEGVAGNVENHEIIGNWFDFQPGYNDRGIAFRIHRYTADPSDISNVYILHNIFTGGHRIGFTDGRNLNVYNNIFDSATFGSVTADVAAGTNLYHDTAVWKIDTDPIVGEPIYTEVPIGPLAEGSPGKGQATVLRGYDLGNDVGLPSSTENLAKLEISIIQSLEEHFLYEEIKEAMEQGGVSYDDDGDRLFDLWEKYYFGSPAMCDPNADPDNDGIANLEEYANGTDPLEPNSIP